MIVVLVFIIYSNTLNSPWVLDDFHNVVNNPNIQIKRLSYETIKGSFFSADPEKLYRPLSCLTFALNAIVGEKHVLGYHLVNITIHAATALILMWLLFLVFKTPALQQIPDREKHFIIILSTVLWAIHPIQIQAITYIVQRMAALCAFFSLISLSFFIKARLAGSCRQKMFYIFCCGFGTTCAFWSKENGIIVLPIMLMLEYFLFRKGDYRILLRKEFILIIALFIIFAAGFLFYATNISDLSELYTKRPFSLYERLMTQPKILLYYLSQIFYPLPNRFSLEHEILISSGIFSPPQTFLYLALVILSFTACVISSKIPLLVRLGVVFYFVAHSVESSILPLEMVFEHRNYLPSAFLFLPLTAMLYHLSERYKYRRSMSIIVSFFIIAILFLTSLATYTRNFDWRSGEAIWLDAMMKAPGHARPKQSMGFVIGMKNPEKALAYYSKGLNGYMHDPKDGKASTLTNMGLIFFHQNKYDSARHFFNMALKTDKNYKVALYFLIQTYMKKSAWEKAIAMIDQNHQGPELARLKAACLLQVKDYNQAIDLFRKDYQKNPKFKNSLLNIAEAFSMAGYQKRATFFYNFYLSENPKETHVYLRMSKNYYSAGDIENASKSLQIFFKMTGAEKVKNYFHELTTDILVPMIGIQKMEPFIASEFEIYKKNIISLPQAFG